LAEGSVYRRLTLGIADRDGHRRKLSYLISR
jgi:hypothetical protein